MTALDPQVGAVTTVPPEAFSSAVARGEGYSLARERNESV